MLPEGTDSAIIGPIAERPELHRYPVRIPILAAALAACAALGASGCQSRVKGDVAAVQKMVSVPSTTTSRVTSTTIDTGAAITIITQNWERFFLAGTPLAERETLLEDGSRYAEALSGRATDPLQAQASAKVRRVDVIDGQHARVVYDVLLGGTVALPAAEGNAVFQDRTWKVSAESFCSLISLGASAPIPGCA